MPTSPIAPQVAVVIASCDRPSMLADRALHSVVAQTRPPDYLVVVDDSRHHTSASIREIVEAVGMDGCATTYIRNARSAGASGAWNSAFDHLFEAVQDPEHLFVAILDDDDAWDCQYLEACLAHVCDSDLDMVASDLRRIEGVDREPLITRAPQVLRTSEFLTGNPGIQGSNLFLRFSVLLAAGGFDEELRSSTDRDLCIRLADLGYVRYGRLARILVDHHAEPDRPRLSIRGSDSKLEGLSSFWNKYVGRMTHDQARTFCERAEMLFDWRPPSTQHVSARDCATDERADLVDGSEAEREASARHRVSRRFSAERLRVLGSGDEAVVLTDERIVYKCFDDSKSRLSAAQLKFLQSQVGRWGDTSGLYSMRGITSDGRWAILTYDYEPSTTYEGGHEAEIVRLLEDCCRVGIVCNNVHPKNLIVTAAGVKLIDYGADIRPWSPLGFAHMARRAYIACRFAEHPSLELLVRLALTDDELPELAGYQDFKARLDVAAALSTANSHTISPLFRSSAPAHAAFSLYVGVISSDPPSLQPLLRGLRTLADSSSVKELRVLVLDNGAPEHALEALISEATQAGLRVALVTMRRQQADAAAGVFGQQLLERPPVRVGIAHARTMVQRYVGALMESDPGSIAWILDDDMRIDARALEYMSWLPAFREQGVDVLLGAYEGSSPNPSINGLRVQLVDLFHNVLWLRGLSPADHLPDRRAENAVLRRKYPDYYYDLSRKHTGHLEMPHWLEPAFQGETVQEAYRRLTHGAGAVLRGSPLTRPLLPPIPDNPLQAARDSVNRGGITFIFDHRALTQTPNSIPRVGGYEARRSDMIWAIVNRHYRGLTVKATGFPIRHSSRSGRAPDLDTVKVQGEIMGSVLYGALTEFLASRDEHTLAFSQNDLATISELTLQHQSRRLRGLTQSVHRIMGLRSALGSLATRGELDQLLSDLDRWFTPANLARIETGARALHTHEVETFLTSLQQSADDYAAAAPAARRLTAALDALFRAGERSAPTCP